MHTCKHTCTIRMPLILKERSQTMATDKGQSFLMASGNLIPCRGTNGIAACSW